MNRPARKKVRRWLLALLGAALGILVLAPVFALYLGGNSNLEELVKPPTRVARVTRVITNAPPPTAVVPTPGTAGPTPTALPPLPGAINGIPVDRIVVLSDAVREHIRDIYAQGQAQGRNSRAFSKVGDSTMVYPPFMAVFDEGHYRLGTFARLQATIDYHAGSFARISAAVKKGMHTWTQFSPDWAPDHCQPDEAPLACELRLQNPSVAFIRLGANDTSDPPLFRANLRRIVLYCLERGIIPVLGTKPDRHEGPANTINNLIRQTASGFNIPLWDYDLIVGTVPGRGLESDLIHMRGGSTRNFGSPAAFAGGDSIEDLTALLMLDAIHREVIGGSLASR